MKKQRWVVCALVVMAGAGCAGASGTSGSKEGGDSRRDASSYPGSGGSSGAVPVLNIDAAAVAKVDAVVLPPEQEQNVSFLAPRAGATFVYVANPSRNTVTAINSTNLAITEQAPGDSPTYLATVPGQDVALVINTGSHTLRVLQRDQLDGDPIPIVAKANAIAIAPDGMHAVVWFDAAQQSVGGTPSTPTTGSTQEVSVVDLSQSPAKATAMSVGYRPSAVVFSQDSQAAFVVTDDGISKLRFAEITKDGIAPFTRLDTGTTTIVRRDAGTAPPDTQTAPPDTTPPPGTPPATGGSAEVDGGASSVDGGAGSLDGGGPPVDGETMLPDSARPPSDLPPATPDLLPVDTRPAPAVNDPTLGKPVDVSVTTDGAYAVARRENSAQLLLVDLKTDKVTALNLSSPVTDLDLFSPESTGAGAAVFAVLRAESTLLRIDIPDGFTDETHRYPWPLQGGTIGSVTLSSKGKYAVLYSTATEANRLVVLDLTVPEPQPQTVVLAKPIRAVAVAPDESTALVLHVPPTASGAGGAAGAGGSSGSADKSFGYTLVRLQDTYDKEITTAADPNPFAITPNSSHAFVLLRDDKAGVRIAQRIDLGSFIVDSFPLGSPPNSIAALSQDIHKVFVGQVYSEGRISFIDWESGVVQTVTGFALNGRIRQ